MTDIRNSVEMQFSQNNSCRHTVRLSYKDTYMVVHLVEDNLLLTLM